jgi:hypothetical protein
MTRQELKKQLLKKMFRMKLNQYDDGKIEIKRMLAKFDLIPDNDLFNYQQKNSSIYHFVNDYGFKRNVSSNKNSKKVYYKLTENPDCRTEKAIGVITGDNGSMINHDLRYYIEWIPISQIIEENGKIYIPYWIIRKNAFGKYIDKTDRIDR